MPKAWPAFRSGALWDRKLSKNALLGISSASRKLEQQYSSAGVCGSWAHAQDSWLVTGILWT